MASIVPTLTSFTKGTSWFEVYATFSTFMMLLRTAFNDLIPRQVQSFITTKLHAFFSDFQQNDNKVCLKIIPYWDEIEDTSELYNAALEYLPSRITKTYKSLKIGKVQDYNNLVFAIDGGEEVVDQFEGINFTWRLHEDPEKEHSRENRNFVLSFNEKHREIVTDKYIPHVLTTYEAIKAEQRILTLKSHTNGYWNESELSHPATFHTLALDPELKQAIIDDLERFLKRKEMYKRVGKPWKRGYLLHGPPGTGKSSLIAGMANYLKFDV